jgi:sarcosine reductase
VRLELASYRVEDIDLDEIVDGLTFDDPRVVSVEVSLVRPGEPVRITHVLDAVEPRVKADDPAATFPGALGTLRPAGNGRTNRVAGLAVLGCGSLPTVQGGPQEQEQIVDMAGPGAELSCFSRTTNVVLSFSAAEGVRNEDFDAAVRAATLRAARDLAAATIGREPVDVEVLEHELGGKAGDDGLPSVVLLLQLSALLPQLDVHVYGATLQGFQPTIMNPLEVLDGAITCAEYSWAAMRNPTYVYQNAEIVRELLAADGKRLNFAGLVLCRGYNQGSSGKERAAMLAAKLARELGADGAIVTTDGGGNSHTDTMLTVRHCERAGIRTVAIVAELGGLTDHVPEADALVSTGDIAELVAEWRPQRVVGGERRLDGRLAAEAGPIPVREYLGAANQMGQAFLRAASR